ncbi:SOUL heme-binding protein-domain-containing protein, partial [Baffinella frigidus]
MTLFGTQVRGPETETKICWARRRGGDGDDSDHQRAWELEQSITRQQARAAKRGEDLDREEALGLVAQEHHKQDSCWKMRSCQACVCFVTLIVLCSVTVSVSSNIFTVDPHEFGEIKSSDPPCHLYSDAIESPCFTTVRTEPDFQVREYTGGFMGLWFSTASFQAGWDEAMQKGFQANFEFISGDNDHRERIYMTTPVLATKTADPQQDGGGWKVMFFLGDRNSNPPKPADPVILLENWAAPMRIAVWKFGGWATESSFTAEEKNFRIALARA